MVDRPVHLLQITDLHLQENPTDLMRGENVEARFCMVLDQLMSLSADALLLTGDLSHHAPAAYERLTSYLDELSYPSYWIPGNHDLPDEMRRYAGKGLGQKALRFQNWQVLMLDSTSQPDGRGGGTLSAEELDFLHVELDATDSEHVLLVMHHNPVSVHSAWQDKIGLGQAARFWDVVARYPQVRAVIFGHVHQAWQLSRGDIQLFSSPATAPQFKKGCERSETEQDKTLALPAYTAYTLHPDGKVDAVVNRVAS